MTAKNVTTTPKDAECLVDAVEISAGGQFEGNFGAGSFDRFRLQLDVDASVQFETSGLEGCPGDTLVTILNAEEDELLLSSGRLAEPGRWRRCALFRL